MILAIPPQPCMDFHGHSEYGELANENTLDRYKRNAQYIRDFQDGSSFMRRVVALQEAQNKLTNLLHLRSDWNSFGAEAPTESTVAVARHILRRLVWSDLVPDGIVPSAEGGVAFCFVRGNKYADIECLNSGEVLAVKTTRNEQPTVWALDESSNAVDSTAQSISTYLAS